MNRLFAVAAVAVLALLAPARPEAAPATPEQQLISKLSWRSIGPYIGGRVVAIAGVADQPDLFYMGAVQGGIWKSTNYGQTWTNISDGAMPGVASSIGALAVAPSDPHVIYAGTGESDIRGDFDTGDGIYRSGDAGKTWKYAGLRETHMTSSLVVDPHHPDVVYATSMGHVFVPNPERGVFKTVDGGKTWRKILYVDAKTGANDVVMDPRDPRTLYAAMWQAQRLPWGLVSGGPGSGLYKTTDAGAHWKLISKNPGFAGGTLGKMGVAVSPTDPRVVYAIVQAANGGVFRSADGGATWKRVNAEMRLRQRAFYYMAIYADPTSANIAYVPQVDGVLKTTDGGRHWKAITPPGDHHIIWVNPKHPNILLEGDDGGATVSVDGGQTWSSENNQPTGQYYHVALDDQFPYHVYGAAQDEGAFEGPSASAEGLGLGGWHAVAFGESTFVAPDPDDPDITFGSGYYSAMARMNTPLGTIQNVSPWPKYTSGASSAEMAYRFGWSHPIFFSPSKPHELLVASQVVFASDDFGRNWRILSPDLTRNDKRTEGPSGGPIDYDQTGAEVFPDISALAVSPLDGDVMWAGSADGLVHVTTDGGAAWKAVTPPALPQWARITTIEPSHVVAGTAYLSASRYMWDDFHPYVFKTTDYGAHWTAISAGLPSDQYVFVVRQDPREPHLLFAGTRSTAYVSYDGGARWQPLTLELPGAQVRDIAVDADQGQVVAATHGRAFWILDNLALLEQIARDGSASTSSPRLFAPETAWLSHAYSASGYRAPDSGTNPTYGASVFFTIPKGIAANTPATLSFVDAQGKTVRSFALHLRPKHETKPSAQALLDMDHATSLARDLRDATAIDPGSNLFVWDLRYPPATEVRGYHIPVTDDFDDGVDGPTALPGEYTVVLDYAGRRLTQPLTIALDPRVSPANGALAARLALGLQVRDTLDALNRAINAAMAARPRLGAAARAKLDAELRDVVEMRIASTEGDVLHETRLRDYLAFLLNELDGSYAAPTPAEQTLFTELRGRATVAIDALDAIAGRPGAYTRPGGSS